MSTFASGSRCGVSVTQQRGGTQQSKRQPHEEEQRVVVRRIAAGRVVVVRRSVEPVIRDILKPEADILPRIDYKFSDPAPRVRTTRATTGNGCRSEQHVVARARGLEVSSAQRVPKARLECEVASKCRERLVQILSFDGIGLRKRGKSFTLVNVCRSTNPHTERSLVFEL